MLRLCRWRVSGHQLGAAECRLLQSCRWRVFRRQLGATDSRLVRSCGWRVIRCQLGIADGRLLHSCGWRVIRFELGAADSRFRRQLGIMHCRLRHLCGELSGTRLVMWIAGCSAHVGRDFSGPNWVSQMVGCSVCIIKSYGLHCLGYGRQFRVCQRWLMAMPLNPLLIGRSLHGIIVGCVQDMGRLLSMAAVSMQFYQVQTS